MPEPIDPRLRTAVLLGIALLGTIVVLTPVWIVHRQRPPAETDRPSAAEVRATGKCAECHDRVTPGIVRHYEDSVHFREGVTCLDCHQGRGRPDAYDHHGFRIVKAVTSGSCARCHPRQYEQFVRSRHGVPAWTAVRGKRDLTPEQIRQAKRVHPAGIIDRPANPLALLEGPAAMRSGCLNCHDIGRPNPDGSIGSCFKCHAKHSTSIRLARLSRTCGACHMGPDHAQLEIWSESKHGILFDARADRQRLDRPAGELSVRDNDTPTCATCHMSGLDELASTHDVGERLSVHLADPVSTRRRNFGENRRRMQEVCLKCHSRTHVESFYRDADRVLELANEKLKEIQSLMKDLYDRGILTRTPFDESVEYEFFELWHHYGRTAKHGAYMGGADFVQWHGFYEMQKLATKLREFHERNR